MKDNDDESLSQVPADSQMPTCTTFDQVMDAAEEGVGPDQDAKVMLVELARGDASHLAFVISGPERVKVAEFLLGSLDRLFEAIEQQNQLRRAQQAPLIKAAP